MKGMIFNSLGDLVETQYGLPAWNRVLSSIDSVVDGAYVGSDSYPPEEMQALVGALVTETGLEAAQLLDLFGQKLFGDLYALYPELVDTHTELVPFMTSLDDVIHTEMKVLHVDAEVPTMSFRTHDRRTLYFEYRSPRKLCLLAEGLIRGAAQHFGQEIELDHYECMHRGAEACQFKLMIKE